MSLRYYLLSFLLVLAFLMPVSAQKPKKTEGQTDSVVVLMNAKSARLMEKDGEHFREVIEGRFLHNDTYLICDTALWNVDRDVINAVGHVRILQENTELSSETLEYVVKINLARFRGNLVELKDKEGNVLRTRYLDYNTKDSTAFFDRGASMKSKDGQVIESEVGEYDSKISTFTFSRDVDMYTDSVFISTSLLYYHSDTDIAEFSKGLNAWKDDNMLSSDEGVYERPSDKFFFKDNVHVMSPTQEGWADSLFFDRKYNDLDMRGNVQVVDTTRHVTGLSDYLIYVDTLSRVSMTGNAAVIAEVVQDNQKDTVYFGADRLVYYTVPGNALSSELTAKSKARLDVIESDPVQAYRQAAAEEAAKANEEKMNENGGAKPKPGMKDAAVAKADDEKKNVGEGPAEGEKAVSSEEEPAEDTPSDEAPEDEAPLVPADSTDVAFMQAVGNVRLFKSDIQMVCDSLEYSALDSIAVLFKNPLIWNEGNRQYSSDSVYIAVTDQRIRKADLMSNGFIIIEEEEGVCYDQIRGAEIMAHFDSTSLLKRFDALGGASALFFLEENEAFATVNKVESKMLSANFKDGEISRIHYYDSPKNDAYPFVQLPESERKMKGFNWTPEKRPAGKEDITVREPRPSEREQYQTIYPGSFFQTSRFFPGYIDSVRKLLESRDSIKAARRAEAALAAELSDSLSLADSLDVASGKLEELSDSLSALSEAQLDTLAAVAPAEQADSLAALPPAISIKTPAELRAEKEAERAAKRAEAEAKRQARLDARQERWDALDARDAIRQAKKDAVSHEKQRKRTLQAVIAAEKDAARDKKKLDRYVKRYEAMKEKEYQKLLKKSQESKPTE